MKKIISVMVMSVIWVVALAAQESTNSSGGVATGEAGSVSYSVGETFYNSYTTTSGSISEGVQQPYEITVVIGESQPGIDLRMKVYPNPASELLILKITNDDIHTMHWIASLVDLNGRVIKQQDIASSETTLDLTEIAPATYFLRVQSKEKEIKVFKINKNQ